MIHDSYCLVTLVDNDFPQPTVLWSLLQEMLALTEGFQDKNGFGDEENEMLRSFDQIMKCKVQDGNNQE